MVLRVNETDYSPGIYHGITFTDYQRWPLMSQSVLKCGKQSMKHLKCALDGQREFVSTDDMLLGSALHTAFLEPAEFPNRVALWEGGRRYGKEWDAYCNENASKVILTQGYHEKLCGMVAALRADRRIQEWAGRVEGVEVSCVGNICGVPFKGRVDAITADPIWDLKKTVKMDDHSINSTIKNFGYHIQAHCYRKLFGRDRFCLAFVEDSPPFDVRVVELSPAWLRIGRDDTNALLGRYLHCVEHNKWPGVSEEIDLIEPPTYLSDEYAEDDADAITFNGVGAFGKKE